MLTKEERAEITERLKNFDCKSLWGLYKEIIGEEEPGDTSYREDVETFCKSLIDLCDTSNMLELPLDKDGEVIRVGDTVYVDDDVKYEVAGYMMRGNSKDVILAVGAEPVYTKEPANKLTHKKPATNKSLASDIKRIANQGQVERKVYEELFRIAKALEKLGDSDD